MRSSTRRVITALAALAALALFAPFAARAQAPYPSQTIKLIVPYPAGGLPDTVARVVANGLQARLHTSVVVENRPGASGALGAATLLSAHPDGYTLLVTDGAVVSINPKIHAKLGYDPKALAPVALLARAPLFLAVHPKVPVDTLKEFIAYAKAHPGELNYGSSGVGSVHHLSMEAMKAALHLNITHVPYKGTAESVPALLGGHVDVAFSAYPSLSGAADGKRIKLIATNGAKRSPQAPNLPAIAEIIPGFDFAPIVGIYARTDMPAVIAERIAAEATAVLKEKDAVRRLVALGVEPEPGGPSEFRKALQNETDRVAKAVKAAGLKPQ